MKSHAQKRRQLSPEHKRSVRRRIINKSRTLLGVLGGVCLAIGITLGALAIIQGQGLDAPLMKMSGGYAGSGLVLLLFRMALGGRRRSYRHSDNRNQPRKDGSVLILTLILISLMTALALHLHQSARLTRQMDARLLLHQRLRHAATDEAFSRLRELARDDATEPDHLDKPWTATREHERPDDIATMSRVLDLNRYLDINNLVIPGGIQLSRDAERMLADAMTQTGDFTPIDRLAAVTDWIDIDADGIRESSFYLNQTPPYRTPDTWLHTWNELLLIHGFSPGYFEPKPFYSAGRPFSAHFTDLITVIPGPRERPIPMNINTAPRPVLEALFGAEHENIIRYIVMARAERPIRSIDALLAHTSPDLFHERRPFMDVRSTHFLIEVHAVAQDEHAGLRVIAHRDANGALRILQWVL